MMKWKKIGHIFNNTHLPEWADNSALTPTPFLLNEEVIRIYAGFRNMDGTSQIGYVDLDATEPRKIIQVSAKPILSLGRPGCFDDNGVILGDVIRFNNQIYLYYVGFQKVQKAKFLAYSGLAISSNGKTFERISEAPILDRCHGANTIRAIHTVRYEDGIWKIWYAVGDDWQKIDGIDYPKYNIWYTESSDGTSFTEPGQLCVDVSDDEYRIGRPSVYKIKGQYIMLYTKGDTSGTSYFPGVAYSDDGVTWKRKDDELGLTLSPAGEFDSNHLCYPRLIYAKDRWLAFYNGNNMGKDGFGAAELTQW